MRTFPAWMIVGWTLATSVLAVPTDAGYSYWGPAYGERWPGSRGDQRIDARYWEGYFTPDQIREIWGTYHQQREQLVTEARRRFPNNPGAQYDWVEKKLEEKGGPKDQLAAKRDKVTKNRSGPDWSKVDEARAVIQEEQAKLTAANNENGQRKAKSQPNAFSITDASRLKGVAASNLNEARSWLGSVGRDLPGQLASFRPGPAWASLAGKVPPLGITGGFRPIVA